MSSVKIEPAEGFVIELNYSQNLEDGEEWNTRI